MEDKQTTQPGSVMDKLSERDAWATLGRVCKSGDMASFWTLYADYLRSRNILSVARLTLYTAALKTAEKLNESA